MSLPEIFSGLRLPVVAAPMFLVSGTRLVIEACKSGIVGTMPALNFRSSEEFDAGLVEIKSALKGLSTKTGKPVPYGINLIVHKSNPRLEADLAVCIKHQVPLIITSLGAVAELVDKIHAYGGVVFHDVTTSRHAQKAAAAGVDGLIAVCAGAGGHSGRISPFTLTAQIRKFYSKTLLLAGALSNGRDILAAQVMGADLAYLGTRFIATQESSAPEEYKKMVVDTEAEDIIYTPAVSGVPANFMKASLEKAGFRNFTSQGEVDFGDKLTLGDEAKRWKDIWSAGHGVSNIKDVPAVADLVNRLESEYKDAQSLFKSEP